MHPSSQINLTGREPTAQTHGGGPDTIATSLLNKSIAMVRLNTINEEGTTLPNTIIEGGTTRLNVIIEGGMLLHSTTREIAIRLLMIQCRNQRR